MNLFLVFKLMIVASWMAFLLYPVQVSSAEIYLKPNVAEPTIIVEGKFETGDALAFSKLVKKQHGNVADVEIFSPGGNLLEAMAIGKLMRELALRSNVPFGAIDGPPLCRAPIATPRDPQNCVCASACFFAHVGAVDRLGNKIGVHRPFFEPEFYSGLSASDARSKHEALLSEARRYLAEMGVPSRIVEEIFAIPPDEIEPIHITDIMEHFMGRVPYLDDWVDSKCSRFMSERDLYEYRRIWSKGSRGNELSPSEENFFNSKSDEYAWYISCEYDALKSARLEGYQAVFGIHPNDIEQEVPVNLWIGAVDLIGRDFSDLAKLGFVQTLPNQMEKTQPGLPEVSVTKSEGNSEAEVDASYVEVDGVSTKYIDVLLDSLATRFGGYLPENSAKNPRARVYAWSFEGLSVTFFVAEEAGGKSLFLAVKAE